MQPANLPGQVFLWSDEDYLGTQSSQDKVLWSLQAKATGQKILSLMFMSDFDV
jgi:hypothetical protein